MLGCCGHQQPPSLFSISNNTKQMGTLNKIQKTLCKTFCILLLEIMSHRVEKIKHPLMSIIKNCEEATRNSSHRTH